MQLLNLLFLDIICHHTQAFLLSSNAVSVHLHIISHHVIYSLQIADT